MNLRRSGRGVGAAVLSMGLSMGLGLGLGLGLASGPARADQSDSARFALSLKGIPAGTLSIEGRQSGGRYSAEGTLKSGGLLGMLKAMRYDASVQGTVAGARLVPSAYTEKADTPKRKSLAKLSYARGVPQALSYDPPREADGKVALSSQGGTLDPLSALYVVLRDVDAASACATSFSTFDGKRAAKVTLGKPRTEGERVTCTGEYRRVAGFSEAEMAEKTRFPFTLVYAPVAGGRLRAEAVTMDTVYGKGVLKRQ